MKKINIKDLFKGKGAPLTKAEKKKKTILLLLKIFPLNFVFGFLLFLVTAVFRHSCLNEFVFFIGSRITSLFFLHPFYLAFLNFLEKDAGFFRRLFEMFLFLSPYFLLFLNRDNFSRYVAMIYCIYVYAAMIISWTIFYFSRKFYDKKYKAKAVEAEN